MSARIMVCGPCEATYNRTISEGATCPECGSPGRLLK